MEEYAKRIKMLLEETGMTQQELADKSGVHKSKISKYLKGEYCPKADSAKKIADVFNVSPVWVMGVESPKYLVSEAGKKTIVEITRNCEYMDDEQLKRILEYVKMLKAYQKGQPD